jgi:hypothetical protein
VVRLTNERLAGSAGSQKEGSGLAFVNDFLIIALAVTMHYPYCKVPSRQSLKDQTVTNLSRVSYYNVRYFCEPFAEGRVFALKYNRPGRSLLKTVKSL